MWVIWLVLALRGKCHWLERWRWWRGAVPKRLVSLIAVYPPPPPSSRHQPNQVLQRSLQHSSWLWLGLFIAEAILRRTSLNVNTWVLASRMQQIHFLDVRLDLWQSKVFFLFFCPSIIISSSLVGEQQGGKSAKGEYNWPFQSSTCTVHRTRSA